MKALDKDILREVKKSGLRFFYICSIIALGVAFFCGIKATSPSMIKSALDYFSQTNLSDFRLMSTYGLRDKDIQTLSEINGVTQAIGGYSTDQVFQIKDEKSVLKVLSIPTQTGQNQPILTEGRFPTDINECLVEDSSTHIPSVAVGETISVIRETQDSATNLKTDTFTIVGFIQNPQYISLEHGNTNIGDGTIDAYIMVQPEAFDFERFTEAYIYTDISAQGTDPYSDEYSNAQEEMISTLEKTGDQILDDNISEIKHDAQLELDKAQAELDKNINEFNTKIADAQAEIDNGQKELDDGYRQYYEGLEKYNTEIASAEDQLRQGRIQLNQGFDDYLKGRELLRSQLEAGQNQLILGRNQLLDGLNQYRLGEQAANEQLAQGYKQLEESRNQIASGYQEYEKGVEELESKLAEGQAQIDLAKEEFNKGYDEYMKQLNSFNEQIQAAQDQIDEGYKKYNEGLQQYNEQKNQFETTIANARAEIEKSQKQIENQEQIYQDGLKQYQQALDQYNKEVAKYPDGSIPNYLKQLKQQLDQQKIQLDQAKQQIDAAKAQLQQGIDQLNKQEQEGKEQLYQAALQLDQMRKQLEAAQAELDKQRQEGESQLQPIYQELLKAKAEIDAAQAELDTQGQLGRAQLAEVLAQLQAAEAQLAEGSKKLEESAAQAKQQLELSRQQLINAQNELIQGEQELEIGRIQGENQLNQGYQELIKGEQDLENGQAELNTQKANGQQQLDNSLNLLIQNQNKIDQGRNELETQKADGQKQLDDAQTQINDNRQKIYDLDKGEWYVFSRDDNPGYTGYQQDTERIDKVGDVFPLFFFLVAALVAFTTMTRMVEEERSQIGTLYALGYSRWQIIRKFVVYSGTAALIGATIGWILGVLVLPMMIFTAYNILYNIPEFHLNIPWGIVIASYFISLFCTVGAAVIIALAELKNVPAELMRPKAPKPGKRILLERIPVIWNRLNFISKVSARNIFRYKARFFMTVIGIAGCTALILAGFGLHDAIFAIIPNQFGTVFKYDQSLVLSDTPDFARAIERVVSDERVSAAMLAQQQTITITTDDGSLSAYLVVPDDPSRLQDFVDLHPRTNPDNKITLSNDSMVVSEKLATNYGATPGSTVKLNINNKVVEAKVQGETENYLENYVYMTPDYYRSLMGEDPDYSVIFVNFNESSKGEEAEEEFSTELLTDSNFTSAITTSSIIDSSSKMLNSLNVIVIVMIVAALLLAFIVLNNLTNINISERVREIATLKVLGFRTGETNNYIFRENIILSIFGTILGLFLGVILLRYIIYTVELDIIMFGRKIELASYVYSVLLTLGFTIIVNLTMIPALGRVNMVESLKDLD